MNNTVSSTSKTPAKPVSFRKVAAAGFSGATKISNSTEGMYKVTKLVLAIIAFPLLFVSSTSLSALNNALKGFKAAVSATFPCGRANELLRVDHKTQKSWFRQHGTKNKWPKICDRIFLTGAHLMEPINFLSSAKVVDFGKLTTASVGKVPIFGLVHKIFVLLHASFGLAADGVTLKKQTLMKQKIQDRLHNAALTGWKDFGEKLPAKGKKVAIDAIKKKYQDKMDDVLLKDQKRVDKEAKAARKYTICTENGIKKEVYEGKFRFRMAKCNRKIAKCRAMIERVQLAKGDAKAIKNRCEKYRAYLTKNYKDIPARSFQTERQKEIDEYRQLQVKAGKSPDEIDQAVKDRKLLIEAKLKDTPAVSFKKFRDKRLVSYRAHLESIKSSNVVKKLINHKIKKCEHKQKHLAKVRKRSWVSVALNISKIAIMVLWIVGTAIFGPAFALPFALVFAAVGLISSSLGLAKYLYEPKLNPKKLKFETSYSFDNAAWA